MIPATGGASHQPSHWLISAALKLQAQEGTRGPRAVNTINRNGQLLTPSWKQPMRAAHRQ